jgi:hypothetical protein
MSLPCVGASGAQGSLDELGKAATLFRDPVASESELVAQLKAGTVYCVAIGVEPQPASRDDERRDRRGGDHRERDRGDRRREGGRGEGGRRRGGRGGHRR